MSRSHQLNVYLQHKRHAKSRHGIHSPFVFNLMERMRAQHDKPHLVIATQRQRKLINRLLNCFSFEHLLWLTGDEHQPATYIALQKAEDRLHLTTKLVNLNDGLGERVPEVIIFDISQPQCLLSLWQQIQPLLRSHTMLMITSIHLSREHSKAWGTLCADPSVRLSLDLFRIGLLFFREEFREKQHFALRIK